MYSNKKLIFALGLCVVAGFSSCRKFLDVNTNPNQAQTTTVQATLPAAQVHIASALGVELQITGGIWGQYWTQNPNSSQYRSLEQYAPGQDYFSVPWANLYYANENLFQLNTLADSLHKKQYKAISLILRAYTFQLLADGWGDAPFTDALKGQPTDGGILNPKYDKVSAIYTGCMAFLDSADLLINNSDPSVPGSDDLIYGGNMDKWRKFDHTLKLRMLLRLSNIDPVTAQNGIAALYARTNHDFIGTGDDAFIPFGSSTSNKSPLYAEMSSTTLNKTQNLVGSSTCIDSMNNNNDYRAYVFYTYLASGAIVGIPQGNYDAIVASGTFSIPSHYVAGDANNTASANAPVNFLTSYESYFLQAEAVVRGWAPGANDSSLFYQGLLANFNYYGTGISNELGVTSTQAYTIYVTGDPSVPAPPAYWGTYPYNGTQAARLRHIITQKWFCMCGNQSFESWTEQRRTGYPDFFVVSPHNLTGGIQPKRFLYPTSESTRNANFPGLVSITTKVWWGL